MTREFQRRIVRLINEHGDLAVKICRPYLALTVRNHDSWAFRECFFGAILSLDHIRKRNEDGTPDCTEIPKIIDKLILEFIKQVAIELKQPSNVHMLLPDVETGIDSRLPEKCLNVLCRFDPTRFKDVINRIFGFDRPSSDIYFAKLASFLPQYIGPYTQAVIMWTVNYREKLQDFILQYREPMVMAAIYNNVDLTKTMMLEDEGAVDLLTVLNNFLMDRRNITKHKLEFKTITEAFQNNSDKTLATMAYRYANKRNMFHLIPAALSKRKLADFNYQMFNCQPTERLKTCLQFVNSAATLEEKQENLALVCTHRKEIAFAIAEVLQLPPPSAALSLFETASATRARDEIKLMLNERRVDEIVLTDEKDGKCERKIKLVDNPSQLNDLINWINDQEVVAFDVEANFVFQSSCGNQIATILEISNHEECKVVDIFLLKQQLTEVDWEAFFAAFLRPRLIRVGHDVKNDVDFLIRAFPFLEDTIRMMKPVFSCVQKLIVYMYGNPVYKRNFSDKTPPLALCDVVKELFDEEMPKGLQTSNWQLRPLSRDQLIYAANDAFYTFRVNEFLMDLQYQNPDPNEQLTKHSLYRHDDNKIVKANPVAQDIATFPDLLHFLEGTINEMRNERVRLTPSHEITIVVDAPFFKAVPTLRRIGFRTWDHRDCKDAPAVRDKVVASSIFARKLTEIIAAGDVEWTYVLSNRKNIFTKKTDIFEDRLILDNQEQNLPVLMSNVVRTTTADVDFEAAARRCANCSSLEDILDVPMAAYRLIFKSYANTKGFGDTIPEVAGDLEEDVKAVDLLPDWTHIAEDKLVYSRDGLIVKYPIDNATKTIAVTKPGVDEREMKLKCDTKLVRQIDLKFVKSCYHCGNIY
uniref:3'-5' exonuclease domain-containing protein n=1 Tax=Panagrellus redivivus TaxID=6233 RepID=A0A7E4V762_PANRE